jgi:hypothetical protein
MSDANLLSRPDSIEGKLNYVEPGASQLRRFIATGQEVNSFGYQEHVVPIRNARPHRDRLTLDTAGFELFDHRSQVGDFLDEEEVHAVYEAEAVDFVKAVTGATAVFITNWNLRSTNKKEVEDFREKGRTGRTGRMQPPGFQVHIDQFADAAERFARKLYAERAPEGPGYQRFITFSLWRTFSRPPQDLPLAMCEFGSFADDEGLRNSLIFGDRIPDEEAMRAPIPGEDQLPAATLFKYNPAHRWWFYPDMTRDEAILLKFHDSDQSVAWRCPHTAFADRSVEHPNPRQSIELRCTAFFER